MPLTVGGFFRTSEIGAFTQISGESMFPVDAGGNAATAHDVDRAAEQARTPEQSYRFVSPRQTVILPARIAESLGARLTSVMILPKGESIMPAAEGLARRVNVPIAVERWESHGVVGEREFDKHGGPFCHIGADDYCCGDRVEYDAGRGGGEVAGDIGVFIDRSGAAACGDIVFGGGGGAGNSGRRCGFYFGASGGDGVDAYVIADRSRF